MIGVINYRGGNIVSVRNAIGRLGYTSKVINNLEELDKIDKIIFPGVGHARTALKDIRSNLLIDKIKNFNRPFLGICLGMQIMCGFLEEASEEGLNIFGSHVLKFPNIDPVPHVGWNSVTQSSGHLFDGIDENTDFYFVHSYFVGLSEQTSSICHYQLDFSSSIEKNNFYGTQFHPEKSGEAGMCLLSNFLKL